MIFYIGCLEAKIIKTCSLKEQGKRKFDSWSNKERSSGLIPLSFSVKQKKHWINLARSFLILVIKLLKRAFMNSRNLLFGTSLVAQWLRICLPMQGTRVRALVREDPTCHGATKPVRHNYWACALESASHNYWARVPQLLKPARLEPVLRNKRSHCSEKPAHCNKE